MRNIHDRIVTRSNEEIPNGEIVWAPAKSIWYTGHCIIWAWLGLSAFSWNAVLVFILLTGLVLCGGHSLGMHRKLIHDSFECPLWLARFGAYLGTLVGLGGPFTMMRTHDIRDWAQRQSICHPFFSQRNSIPLD